MLRRSADSLRIGVRKASAKLRVLPEFMIIGAQKAGTTSLYNYLCAHPSVVRAARKEVHYFDIDYARGQAWYRAMFPMSARLRAEAAIRRRRMTTGEASPYYLFHPLAAERVAAMLPSVSIIVLLRDPVERAWSHYRHEVAAGRETLSFAAALDAEPARLAGAEDAIRLGGPQALLDAHRNFSYVARGRYVDQLRVWLEHFPVESFLVLDSADLFHDPRTQWAMLLDFLNLDDPVRPRFEVHNQGPDAELAPALRARLAETFREPNVELQNLLGRTFSWNDSPASPNPR